MWQSEYRLLRLASIDPHDRDKFATKRFVLLYQCNALFSSYARTPPLILGSVIVCHFSVPMSLPNIPGLLPSVQPVRAVMLIYLNM